MSKFEEQIKLPSRFSYRAVGSVTGIEEHLGRVVSCEDWDYCVADDSALPYTDFGAGDNPIGKEDWLAYFSEFSFLQLPFVLSAFSFYYNIPGLPTKEGYGLNLTSCLLARIFDGDISNWNHPDIEEINPTLISLHNDNDASTTSTFPIFVSRSHLGSRSTNAITNYLYSSCPRADGNPKGWPMEKVGATIDWHPSTNLCEGSSGTAMCISENEGAIGYMDAYHGNKEGLNEIKLRNGDGNFLTSREAGVEGVQAAAIDLSNVPNDIYEDYSGVSFYNQPGLKTWPITVASYIYIRFDLDFIATPVRRGLLKAFATALFDPDYIGLCDGLVPVPDELRALSLSNLDMLYDPSYNSVDNKDPVFKWTFEKSTMVGLGQGNHVISMKRNSFNSNEVDHVNDDVSKLTQRVGQLELELASMNAKMELLLAAAAADATASSAVVDDSVTSTGDDSDSNMDTVNEPLVTQATVAAVAGSPNTSIDATVMNQPAKTGDNATAVVIGDTTATNVNASVEVIDEPPPPLMVSSSKSFYLFTCFGTHHTALFLLSSTLLLI